MLDNTADSQMLLDGEPVAIAVRSQQELISDYPLIVEFDDGSPARKARSFPPRTSHLGQRIGP